jgi:N-acyl-D-amino-acid deacylase
VSSRILLRGGLIADGIGATTRRADLLIEGETIASIQRPVTDGTAAAGHSDSERTYHEPPVGCEVIDLTPGSVVCPGFIDAHAHAEGPLLECGRVDGALAQGVTTLVVGQDGQSWIGASAGTAAYLNRYFGPVNGTVPIPLGESGPLSEAAPGPLSVAGYRAAVSGRLAQNVAVLASQGTIRHNVAGLAARPLDQDERAAARRQVEDALADGAAGLSSGLDYLPSRFGRADEVAVLARPLAAADRPYVSHLRGYGANVGPGLAELVAVGAASGTRVHASHLWGPPPAIEVALAAAADAGVTVTFDAYPYRRSSTILAVLLLSPELQAGGPDRTVAALTDPARRARLLAGEKFTDAYLQNLYLGCLPAALAEFAGQSLTAAAASAGQPAGEWTLDLLARTGLHVGAHLDRRSLADEHLAWLVRHDRHCAGSDGIYQGQHPHPRGFGAFARLAGSYPPDKDAGTGAGREAGENTSQEADGQVTGYQQLARHLAANAAGVYGLRDRGRLAPGLAADICVIAPGGLTERATDETPTAPAAGVDLVFVNGAIAWRDGAPVPGSRGGRVVI